MKIFIPAGLYEIEREGPDGTRRRSLEHLEETAGDLDVEAVPIEDSEAFARRLWLDCDEELPERVEPLVRMRDLTLIYLCAERLQERGHAHAANSLRKMAREGEIP